MTTEGIITTGAVTDLTWFQGDWHGEKDGNTFDESWSTPDGGTIMGMFRWLKNGSLHFYEFMAVEPEDNTLVFRIKHLNRGLVSWEEKDQATNFYLERLEPRHVVFAGRVGDHISRLIYDMEDENTLTVTLETTYDDGRKSRLEFPYKRRSGAGVSAA